MARTTRSRVDAKSNRRIRFFYTEVQWDAIERSVRTAGGRALDAGDRRHLCFLASNFRWPAFDSRENREWGRRTTALRGQIVRALLEAHRSVLELRRHWGEDERYGAEIGEIVSLVDRFDYDLEPCEWDRRGVTPRVLFCEGVIDVFITLGCDPSYTNVPITDETRGPVIDFFEAVAGPAMGAGMPSRTSLPAIVRRVRREHDKAIAELAELRAKGRASRKGTLNGPAA